MYFLNIFFYSKELFIWTRVTRRSEFTRLSELVFTSDLCANILYELKFNSGLYGRVKERETSKKIWMTVLQRFYYYICICIILYYLYYIHFIIYIMLCSHFVLCWYARLPNLQVYMTKGGTKNVPVRRDLGSSIRDLGMPSYSVRQGEFGINNINTCEFFINKRELG